VGARAARQLVSTTAVDRVLVSDIEAERAHAVVASLGEERSAFTPEAGGADVVILACPGETHVELARRFVAEGVHVISVADGVREVRALLELDDAAKRNDVAVVVGAGFSPGLTGVL